MKLNFHFRDSNYVLRDILDQKVCIFQIQAQAFKPKHSIRPRGTCNESYSSFLLSQQAVAKFTLSRLLSLMLVYTVIPIYIC